jgi:hypothetical protein
MRSHHVHRDSRPPPHHDDGPNTQRDSESHKPSKAMAMLSHAIRPRNSGNPTSKEHDLICSHDGHHTSGHYGED